MKTKQKRSPFRPYLPLIGLVMALSLGVVAWVLAPALQEWAVDNVAGISGYEFGPTTMQIIFASVIFFFLLMFASILVSIAAPKQKMNVSMTDLKSERAANLQAKKDKKRRMAKMRKDNNR